MSTGEHINEAASKIFKAWEEFRKESYDDGPEAFIKQGLLAIHAEEVEVSRPGITEMVRNRL